MWNLTEDPGGEGLSNLAHIVYISLAARVDKDITDRQRRYVRGLVNGLSFQEAATEAGYEVPVFEETEVRAYGVDLQGVGVVVEMLWLLPQEVD